MDEIRAAATTYEPFPVWESGDGYGGGRADGGGGAADGHLGWGEVGAEGEVEGSCGAGGEGVGGRRHGGLEWLLSVVGTSEYMEEGPWELEGCLDIA